MTQASAAPEAEIMAEMSWFPSKPAVLRGKLDSNWAIATEGVLPPGESFVYAVALADTSIPRCNGRHSRLLYVGKGYANRPAALRTGYHSASHALDQVRRGLGRVELPVELWVCPVSNSSLHEVAVLNACVNAYGELPPANRKWEGYLSGQVLREMAGWALEDANRKRGRLAVYEWPDTTPCSVWVDVMAPGPRDWEFSLGWFHTQRLLAGRSHPVPSLAGQLVLVDGQGARNALADIPGFESWGRGELRTVPADPLDGLEPDSAVLQRWLDRYTGNGWRRGQSALDTLKKTLESTK